MDAQSIEFPFPAVQLISVAQAEDSARVFIAGGHTFARCELAWSKLQVTSDKLVLGRGDIERLWYGERDRIAGGVEFDSSKCVLFGSREHESGWVGLFDLESRQFTWSVELATPVTAVCRADDGLVLGDEVGMLRQLRIASGEEAWRASQHANQVTAVCRVNAKVVASGDWSGGIKLVDLRDGLELGHFAQHRDRISGLLILPSVASSSQPQLVSASRDGTVRLWYPQQLRMVRFVQLDQPIVQLVAVGEDQHVVVATEDGGMHLVDLGSAKVIATEASGLPYPAGIGRLSPEGWLVLDGLGAGRLWQLPASTARP